MTGQMLTQICHQHCTFYIFRSPDEWAYFSGTPCEINNKMEGNFIDSTTGYFIGTFEVMFPDNYIVQGIVRKDVRHLDERQVLLSLENLFYQQLLKHQQEQQFAILQLMTALNSSLKIKPLLQAIMDYALAAIPTIDRGFLMLYDKKFDRLSTVSSSGMTHRIYDYEPTIGEGMAGYTFQTGKSGIYTLNETIKIMWNVTDSNKKALVEALGNEDIRKNISMAVPIAFGDHKFGVMIVHQYTNKRAFQQNDLRLLESFASQAAVALRNAEAYEQIEHLNLSYQKQDEIHKKYLHLSLQGLQEEKIIETTRNLLQVEVRYINLVDQQSYLSNEEMRKLSQVEEAGVYQLSQPVYIYPVQNEQEVFGFLLMERNENLTKQQQMIIENTSMSLSLRALQRKAKNQESYKERFELFQNIISGHAPIVDPRFEDLNLKNK